MTSAPISPHPLHLMAGDVKTRRLAINLINSKYLFFLSNVLGKPALGHTDPSKQCQSLSLLRPPSTPVTASCAHLSHHILHVKGHRQIVNRSNRLAQAAETQRITHFESCYYTTLEGVMNNARKECPLDSLELELLPAMSNIPGKSCISLLFLFTNSRHKLKTTQSFKTRYWTGAARLNTFIAVTAMLHYHLLQHRNT